MARPSDPPEVLALAERIYVEHVAGELARSLPDWSFDRLATQALQRARAFYRTDNHGQTNHDRDQTSPA